VKNSYLASHALNIRNMPLAFFSIKKNNIFTIAMY
jgi:hypothetical protein